MNKKNTAIIWITIMVFLSLVGYATYAYFAVGNLNVTNVANLNGVSEKNNMVFMTIGGGMNLTMTAGDMGVGKAGNMVANNTTTLKVEFTANTTYAMVCKYDIQFIWTSTTANRYTAHSTGVSNGTKEFTIQATMATGSHVNQGTNSISTEKDIAEVVGNVASKVLITDAKIDSTSTTKNTATWTLTSKFYNVNADQSGLAGKTFDSKFAVTNVRCSAGTISS